MEEPIFKEPLVAKGEIDYQIDINNDGTVGIKYMNGPEAVLVACAILENHINGYKEKTKDIPAKIRAKHKITDPKVINQSLFFISKIKEIGCITYRNKHVSDYIRMNNKKAEDESSEDKEIFINQLNINSDEENTDNNNQASIEDAAKDN